MLSISDVSYRYKRSVENALTDINLEISCGEVFGLLGPNGAGKTTLLSLVCGILPIQQGKITMKGDRDKEWCKLSVVPQEHAFYPMLTVRENLDFFARVQGLKSGQVRSRIDYTAAVTGLELSLKKIAGHCSGGIKRRLNLAVGLLSDPELLLLDEPAVGVDPQSRAFILKSIKELADGGKTIIYTSHQMEEVEHLCKHVTIMDQGRILLTGKLDDLLGQQQTSTAQLVLGELQPQQQAPLESTFPELDFSGKTLSMNSFSEQRLAHLLQLCAERQIKVKQIRYGHQNLEELFLSLTKRSLRD